MKNKLTLLLVILLNINYFCFAQPLRGNNKAEALHIAFLTKELALSPNEAQSFWPIYNNYLSELKNARSEQDQLELDERILNIRKRYKPDFKKVLGSDERVNKLFIADKNFRALLRRELEMRRKERHGS